jgi:hypothetical protein
MAKGSLRKFRTGKPDITQESAQAVRGHQQQGGASERGVTPLPARNARMPCAAYFSL